ncbi:TT1751-like protein [Trametes coccinea BRFM310]|uniref:TT1751-like protein n=1 Tax=Trametes coccinea (strain BRFM310) TaxID=1353009 RepID=A0A1Y2IK92_TRAC3|nr:TT1751-like protein [Trametes coccinea BRFM310]
MSETTVEYICRRITYHTPLPFAEVSTRLEKALNKSNAGQNLPRVISTAKTKQDIENGLQPIIDGHDFVYAFEVVHSSWLRIYAAPEHIPHAIVYTMGNPNITQEVLRRDIGTGLHVPMKIMLLEDVDEKGTRIIWDDPTTVMPVPGKPVDEELLKVIEGVAEKLERFVQKLIA